MNLINNLPTRAEQNPLQSSILEDGTICIETSDGTTVLILPPNRQSLSDEVARALERARDVGFRQCQDAIQRALGVRQ
jgi:hypothetical protein